MSGIGVANTAASAGKNLKGNSEEAIEDQVSQVLPLSPLLFRLPRAVSDKISLTSI